LPSPGLQARVPSPQTVRCSGGRFVAAGTPAIGQIASTAVSGHIARVVCNELVAKDTTQRDDVSATRRHRQHGA